MFSVTIKDCEVSTFTVKGPGGSGKDTSQTGVLIRHLPSGAHGRGTETRSYDKNRRSAWIKLANSKEFKAWHKMECARRLGQEEEINRKLDELLLDKNLKIEYY